MNPRIVKQTTVKGSFGFPVGIHFLQRESCSFARTVLVSTVLLDDAYLEDTLKICSPEHGYETMVFLDGCTFFSVFTEKYKNRRQALYGHRRVVKKLLLNKLPLAIPLAHYRSFEEVA